MTTLWYLHAFPDAQPQAHGIHLTPYNQVRLKQCGADRLHFVGVQHNNVDIVCVCRQ